MSQLKRGLLLGLCSVIVTTILTILLGGCASRSYQSGGDKFGKPQVDCGTLNLGGRFQEVCCDGEKCVLVN